MSLFIYFSPHSVDWIGIFSINFLFRLRYLSHYSHQFYIMYKSTLLSTLFIASLAYSLPLTVEIEDVPSGHEENAQMVKDAATLANERILKMEATLEDYTNPVNQARIEAAFGTKADINQIKATVQKMKSDSVPIHTADPSKHDGVAKTSYNRDENQQIIRDNKGLSTMKYVQLGSGFYTMDPNDRAGTLIHEAAHYVAAAGDDYRPNIKQKLVVKGNEKSTRLDMQEAGYATDKEKKNVLHQDIVGNVSPQGRAENFNTLVQGSDFYSVRNNAKNMHDNADSYRVFASLCSRSLYRRALRRGDPVGYYLSKREQCSLPPDYFAKKAATTKSVADGATHGTESTITKPNDGVKGTAGATGVTSPAIVHTDAKASKVAKSAGSIKDETPVGTQKAGTSKGTKGTTGINVLMASKSETVSTSRKGSQAIKTKNTIKGATISKVSNQPSQPLDAKNAAPKQKVVIGAKPQPNTIGAVKKKTSAIKGVEEKKKPVSKPVAAKTGSRTAVKPVSRVPTAAIPKNGGKKQRRDMASVLDELD